MHQIYDANRDLVFDPWGYDGEMGYFPTINPFPHSNQKIQDYLLKLINARKHRSSPTINMWSFGSSTFEEIFTLTILLIDAFHGHGIYSQYGDNIGFPKGWGINVLGTDISPRTIAQAKKGLFEIDSIDNLPDSLGSYIDPGKSSRQFRLIAPLSKHIRFSLENMQTKKLAKSQGPFDLVSCHGGLPKLSSWTQQQAMKRLLISSAPDALMLANKHDMELLDNPELQGLITEQQIEIV